jgi:hypothetical protein
MKKRTVITSETHELWIIRQGTEEHLEVDSTAHLLIGTTPFEDHQPTGGFQAAVATSSETIFPDDTPVERVVKTKEEKSHDTKLKEYSTLLRDVADEIG